MDLRPLGRTGIQVSPLALGTVKLGRTRGLKYPGSSDAQPPALPTDDQATNLLRTAAELGINLLDTAPAYGASEQRLGELLARNSWFGGRDRWVVCSKAGEDFDDATGQSTFDFTPEHITRSIERSLQRLRTDHLDIALIHSDGRDEWLILHSGALDALRALKQRGLIRALGISTKTVDGGLLAARASAGHADVLMIPFNPSEPGQGIVIEGARLRGVGVLVKKALASGHLSTLTKRLPADLRGIDNPIEAALRFSLRTGVHSVVVGTTSPEHLHANAAAADRALAALHRGPGASPGV